MTISLVTPAYNSERFIAGTLDSLLAQSYPALEHIVVDGASGDGTLGVVRRHAFAPARVVSEPDSGMYDAIQKGFALCTGEVMGWVNSDDVLLPGTLRTLGEVFATFPEIGWLTTRRPVAVDEHGGMIKLNAFHSVTRAGFERGDHLVGAGWPAAGWIQQEGTFWRRSLWERAGGSLDLSLKSAGDFELWCRFMKIEDPYTIDVPLGAFRYHAAQKTSVDAGGYLSEARGAYARHGFREPVLWKQRARMALHKGLGEPAFERLARRGVVSVGRRVTYDWAQRRWVIEAGGGV